MKKLLATVLALLLLCAALAEESWYVDEGRALALRTQVLASDEAYFSLFMPNEDEEVRRLREGFAGADLSKPSGAWFLPLPDEETLLMALRRLSAMEGGDPNEDPLDGLTDVSRQALLKRLPGAAANVLASQAGVAWVVLAGVVGVGETVEAPEDFRPGYLLLEYPGDCAVLVAFSQSVPGYVGVSTTLVPASSRQIVQSAEDSAKLLGLSLELEEMPVE